MNKQNNFTLQQTCLLGNNKGFLIEDIHKLNRRGTLTLSYNNDL